MKEKSYILHGPEFNAKFPKELTLGKLLYMQLETHETQVAQIQKETNEQLTYKQIFDKSRKLAIYFKNNGIKINDRIGICSENNLNWSIVVCATTFVGATICPINPMYSKREFQHTLNISKPKYIFVSPMVLKSIQNFIKDLSWSPILILMADHKNSNIATIEKLIANVSLINGDNFEVTNVDSNEHIVVVLCSSGTTGLPKGVMLSEKNYLNLIQVMLDGSTNIGLQSQTLMCVLPFFHSYCFSLLVLGLISGSKSIVFSHFKEEAFLETIEKHKISVLSLVPPLMVFLAKHPIVDKYDLSSVKIIWCGAAPLSHEVAEAVRKRLNNPEIRQGYGMTELTLSVLKMPENCIKIGSSGTLVPGISAKVVPIDESGNWSNKTLGPYCEGELCFKGDLVMKGYCNDKKSTSATVDKDGWLHTGDVGYYDEDGFFYIVDRVKELIKYKAFQVPPAELEAILLTHPEIKDAAVVGLPDEEAGELPFAFVVKQPNAKITANDVIKYVNERVSNQKKLRGGVRFLEEIPKNQTGKILRRELRNSLKSKL